MKNMKYFDISFLSLHVQICKCLTMYKLLFSFLIASVRVHNSLLVDSIHHSVPNVASKHVTFPFVALFPLCAVPVLPNTSVRTINVLVPL